MNQNNHFSTVADEMLGDVTGGYLQVSKWRTFVSTQIMPILNGLMNSASESDKAVINTVYSTLQGTMIPNANVAKPVHMLWSNYNTIYRSQLQSDTIKNTMDQTLYSAKQYIDQNS